MLRKLSLVRKASLAKEPTMMVRMIAGINDSSRSERSAAERSLDRVTLRRLATVVSVMAFDTLHRGDDLLVAPVGAKLVNEPALENDEQTIAEDQLNEIVGDDQYSSSSFARSCDDVEQRFFRSDVDTLRGVDQDQDDRIGGEGSAHDGLLLIASA